MTDIYILSDYKGYFGSKQKSDWYQSGMNLDKLEMLFKGHGFRTIIRCFSDIDFRKEDYKNKLVLYTSSEDPGYYYKDYIEDVIYALKYQGAILIPDYKYLRANNNKVFMELLRDLLPIPSIRLIRSMHYGTVEKLTEDKDKFGYPLVIKSAKGAMSSGVYLANNEKELLKYAKKVAKTPNIKKYLWDFKNYIKLSGKIKFTSQYREKFVIQNYVQGLSGDWKILVYGDKYYGLNRENRKNDFRASGSGKFKFMENIPERLLDFAYATFKLFDLPQLSMDIGYDGHNFFLIEFQALYFGTKTLEYSPFYFTKNDNSWKIIKEVSDLEEEYVRSLCNYLNTAQ
jgi:glutathione synthase/RimK-type ligase-like ATP-grasp enzyme